MNAIMLRTMVAGGLLASTMSATGFAATLGISTEAPMLGASAATVDYFEIVTDGDLSSFGAVVDAIDGLSPTGVAEIGFGVGFGLADPTTGAAGGFDVYDDNGLLLGGDLQAVGYTEDTIEFEFGSLAGSAVGSFNESVLMLISFTDSLGMNPFAALEDGTAYPVTISVSNVTPVPVPAALPLFMSAAGLLGMYARRRQS